MVIVHGDMWEEYSTADLFLVTTNSFITKEGKLVMGAGIAKEARDRFSGLDKAFGKRIKHLSRYGILVSDKWPDKVLGAFQVKYHFKDKADLDLIRYSTEMLQQWIKNHAALNIHLNFPGIGNGKLDPADVLEIISCLPNNVFVWTKEPYNYDEDYTGLCPDPLDFGDN